MLDKQKISEGIHIVHTLLTCYIATGWLLPPIHSKVLTLMIPTMYANWILDSNQCILTRLEAHLLKEDKKEDKQIVDGFIHSQLKKYNVIISQDKLDKILLGISFHSFLQSYSNMLYL